MIYKTIYHSCIGPITLASDGKSIIGAWIDGQKYFMGKYKEEIIVNDNLMIFKETKAWLDRYFAGLKPSAMELKLRPEGSDFSKMVWNIIIKIPYGKTITYGEIAKLIAERSGKRKMSAQAVGGAVGHNPISIIIPCHRVVGAKGNLTGYAGGIELKLKLLKHENADEICFKEEGKMNSLEEVQKKIDKCNKCGLFPKLTENSVQKGNKKILIVGESPAKDGWIESKKAFYNTKGSLQASGQVLARLLADINLDLSDIYFTECCKCLVENRNFFFKFSVNCIEYLKEQIANLDCELIITMGKLATEAVTNEKISKFCNVVGKFQQITIANKTYSLVPIYHPSPANPLGYKGNVEIFKEIQAKFLKESE